MKLKVPVLVLLTVNVNGAPAGEGVTLVGLAVQVEGGVPVHDKFTGLLYPLTAVSVPVICIPWLTTLVNVVPLVAMVKSGMAVTVSDKVCVLGAGAPDEVAEMVTVDVPGGVLSEVAMFRVTATGFEAVGFTEAEGEKLQVAPEGSPLQESVTVLLNDPEAVTENVMFCDVLGRLTVTDPGDGAPRPKSTT